MPPFANKNSIIKLALSVRFSVALRLGSINLNQQVNFHDPKSKIFLDPNHRQEPSTSVSYVKTPSTFFEYYLLLRSNKNTYASHGRSVK